MHPKMWCMWKPAQSGKTRSMQEWIRDNEETAEHLNILITSNNRLLVAQLTKRMKDDGFGDSSSDEEDGDEEESNLADDHIDPASKVFSWMSGTSKTKIGVGDLTLSILEDEVKMVCCCAHKVRFKYIIALLDRLEKSKNFNKRISIWIDEADASVKMWAKTFDFVKFIRVDRVVLVSATFESVFKYYKHIRIRGYKVTFNEPTYLRYAECNVIVDEQDNCDAVGYLEKVLDKYPDICEPGSRLFAPGEVDCASHDNIAELLRSRGFAVMIINGQRKEIVMPDGSKIKIPLKISVDDPAELSSALSDLYAKHNLADVPFAITGQICLGRGITFQSQGFMFDYGVVPNLRDDAAIYQCVARLLGNTKQFTGFKRPTIYCTNATDVVCNHLAKKSENIARIAYERGLPDFNQHDIVDCIGEMPSKKKLTPEQEKAKKLEIEQEKNVRLEEFPTMRDLHDRIREIEKELPTVKWSHRFPAAPHIDKVTGKYMCSLGKSSKVQSTDDVRSFAVGLRSWGSGVTESERGEMIFRVYAGYTDGVVTFFLRWTFSKKEE